MLIPGSLCAATQTNLVVEDSWIHGLSDTNPRGSTTSLSICPAAVYWIYLKFDVSAITGIVTHAELRMRRFSGSRPQELSVYRVDNDLWTEAGLTGMNRPAHDTPPLAMGAIDGVADHWTSDTFVQIVNTEARSDGTLSLMVREDPNTQFDVRNYFSKEAARVDGDKPHLVITTEPEAVDPDWLVADVMFGTKPSFDFDPWGGIHVMSMTEVPGGNVFHGSAAAMFGPWATQAVATGYFYGPGDLRCDPSGRVHMAWHNHDSQNPQHVIVQPGGGVTSYNINTPGSHDGWDNGLTIAADGSLHQSSINPSAFGAQNALEYGSFNGLEWSYNSGITGSGPTMYGLNTALAIDKNGDPHIVYCHTQNWTSPGELMYAHRDAGVWQISCVVSGGIRGRFPSIALDHWDRPHVSWLDIDGGDNTIGYVRYGVHNAGVWDIEDVDTLSDVRMGFDDARKSTSLLLDEDWRPHLAYSDEKVIKYATKPFDTWNITDVVQHTDPTYKGLVVLRRDHIGRPGIVFWQSTDGGLVRLARPRQSSFAVQQSAIDGARSPFVIDWSPGIDGYRFTVQCRESLLSGDWTNAPGAWPIDATVWSNATDAANFRAYRIRATPR